MTYPHSIGAGRAEAGLPPGLTDKRDWPWWQAELAARGAGALELTGDASKVGFRIRRAQTPASCRSRRAAGAADFGPLPQVEMDAGKRTVVLRRPPPLPFLL